MTAPGGLRRDTRLPARPARGRPGRRRRRRGPPGPPTGARCRLDGRPDAGHGRTASNPPDPQRRPHPSTAASADAHHLRPRRIRLRGAAVRGQRLPAQRRHRRRAHTRGPRGRRRRRPARPVGDPAANRRLRAPATPAPATPAHPRSAHAPGDRGTAAPRSATRLSSPIRQPRPTSAASWPNSTSATAPKPSSLPTKPASSPPANQPPRERNPAPAPVRGVALNTFGSGIPRASRAVLARSAVCGRTIQRRAPFRSGTSATYLSRYNVSHLSVPPHRFVRNKTYGHGSTETGDETRALGCSKRVIAGQRGGGCEIRTREGLPPTRFPTLLAAVHQWPRPSVTCEDARRVTADERRRTGVNETRSETRRRAAPGRALPGRGACCYLVAASLAQPHADGGGQPPAIYASSCSPA